MYLKCDKLKNMVNDVYVKDQVHLEAEEHRLLQIWVNSQGDRVCKSF